MKKPNILLIQHGKPLSGFNLARLRPVLELLSYQVEIYTGGNDLQHLSTPGQYSPDLVIVNHPLSPESSSQAGRQQLFGGPLGCPQLVLSEERDLLQLAGQNTVEPNFPVDVIALHGRIGQYLCNHPRKHPRMPAHLPCIFSVRGFYGFGEILSLGTGGAFIKSSCHLVRPGDLIDVGIPLLGMKRELEISSRVIYNLTPNSENNYSQGIGIEFVSSDRETTRVLEDFLRLSLLDEISPVFSCFGLPGPQVPAPNGCAASLEELNSRLHFRSREQPSLGCLAAKKA